MEKSSQNEKKKNNNDKTYLNDVVMENERMEKEFEIQPSLQTEESINAYEGKKKWGKVWKNCIFKKKWGHGGRNALC